MARRMPRNHEESRAYMRHICAIIAAGDPPARVLTAEEEADDAIRGALILIQCGAPYGYMAGRRLIDYRRIETIAANLGHARALGLDDLAARTAAAVAAADAIAEPWRGRWE